MARIRTIKPEYFRHEALQDLEIAHPGKYPMMVFAGLWGHCDSKGRFEWKPRMLKLDILPFIPFDMNETLEILEKSSMIHRYTVEGKEYGIVETFDKHQRLTGKESTEGEKYPSPYVYDTENIGEASGKHWGNTGEILESQEGKGKEGKGKEETHDKTSPPDGDVCVSENIPVPANPKKDKPLGVDDLVCAGVDRQVASDWLMLRKAKRLPLTKTALSEIESNAARAGMGLADAIKVSCANGWAGFRSDWLAGIGAGKSDDISRSVEQRKSDAILAATGTRNFV